jgi:U3 small nucleolar RNA-associated protein 14
MTPSAQQKGKGRLLSQDSVERAELSSSPSSSSASSSPSSSSSESESDAEDSSEGEDNVSQEYLDSLLEMARRSIASKAVQNNKADVLEDDIIGLDDLETELKCVLYIFPIAQL